MDVVNFSSKAYGFFKNFIFNGKMVKYYNYSFTETK